MLKREIISIFLIVAIMIQMIPGLILAEESEYFEVTLSDITAGDFTSSLIENVQDMVPEEMRFGLEYLAETFSPWIWFTFTNDTTTERYHQFRPLLTCTDSTTGKYDFEIPFFCGLPTGTYNLTITYPITAEGEVAGAKPFRFTIGEYTTYNPSVESGYFKWHLPGMNSAQDAATVIENVHELLPEAMREGLVYASTSYEEYIYTPAKFSFSNSDGSKIYNGTYIPLICAEYGVYNLEIPYFEDLPSGTYSLTVDLDIAEQKDAYAVKPYKLVIDSFTVNNSAIESEYYEWTLDDITLEPYSSTTIRNLQDILPENMTTGLKYASTDYADSIYTDTIFTFSSESYTTTIEKYGHLLTSNNGAYDLKIPFMCELPSGTYTMSITFPAAGDEPDARPYKFSVVNYTLENPSYESGVFEWTLPDMEVVAGETVKIKNVQNLLPDAMHFGMYYVSSWYNGSFDSEIMFVYSKSQGQSGVSQADSPLIWVENGVYDLEIPVPAEYSPAVFSLKIILPCAYAKGSDDVKPITLIINNLTIKAAGDTHEWDEGKITAEPTCTEDGQILYTCLCGCGQIKTESIAALGHEFENEWTVDKEATCTQDGSESRHCTRCEETTDVKVIEKANHSYTDWYVQKAPTSDEAGSKIRRCVVCEIEEIEEIPALGYLNTTFNIADTVTLNPVKGAEIFISNADGSVNLKSVSDNDGKAFFDLENGVYSVQIVAFGYQPRNFVIEKKDEAAEFSPYLSKNSVVDVETVVKEMTLQEIIDAGIDVDAAENKHIYKCSAVLKFTPVEEGGEIGEIGLIEINFDYICDETGTVIKAEAVYAGGAMIYPVSRDIYLIIYSHTTWLKEMFDVQLVVTNTSAAEKITQGVAKLNLPEGLSLAAMTETAQSLTVNLEDIGPLSEGDVHWYICGDKEGEYYINGSFSAVRSGGGIEEALEVSFTTTEPISVLAGSAMKLIIEAERTAVANEPYKVRYTLQNVSDKTLNNVALDVLGGKFLKAYCVSDIIHEAELGESDGLSGSISDGYKLEDELFEPGEVLSGVFEIIFGIGVYTETDVIYMVTDMFTVTGNGSTTEIPTEIILTDRVKKHVWDEGTVTVEPDCDSEGQRIYRCTDSGCGEIMTTVIPAAKHSYGEWYEIRKSTCAAAGEEIRKCTVCQKDDKRELELNDHSWDEGKITTHSTETSNGVITYTCTVCNQKETAPAPLLSASGSFGDDNGFSWMAYEDGTMYVTGNGAVTDFGAVSQTPWASVRSEIKEVVIEDGVTQIGRLAFARCENLTKVTIPDGVNTIRAGAFKDCESLTQIVLPDSITTIGQNAFLNCTALREATIPAGVVIIKNNAFYGCSSLDTIYFGGGRTDWEKIQKNTGNDLLKDEYIYYEIPSVEANAESVCVYAPVEECILLVVTYRGNMLIDQKLVSVISSIEKTIEEIGINTENTDTFKVFLWNDMNTLAPLCTGSSVQ